MSEWVEYQLNEILEIKYGKDHKTVADGNIPIYGSGGLMRYGDRYLYNKESILIPRKGTLNNIIYKNEPFWTVDTMFYTILDSEIVVPKYLYYNLKMINFNSMNVGSAVPSLTVQVLSEIKVDLPPLQEQKAIAAVLSSLDDKIDLLHRQNQTLEAMAETLFRQWLSTVELEEKPFSTIISSTLGGEWGKEHLEGDYDTEVNCIRGTDIADMLTGLPSRAPLRYVKKKKYDSIKPQTGDVIIEISGGTEDQSTGRCVYLNDLSFRLFDRPIVFSNFCRLIRPIRKEYSLFLYLYLNYLYKQDEFFNIENGSSGIKNLDYKYLLNDLGYLLPVDTDAIELLDQDLKEYFVKINSNKLQIKSLTALRDTLLPKLMSGEVRVKIS